MMCVVSCKLQLKDAFDVLFVFFSLLKKKRLSCLFNTRLIALNNHTCTLTLALLLRDTGGARRGGWGGVTTPLTMRAIVSHT